MAESSQGLLKCLIVEGIPNKISDPEYPVIVDWWNLFVCLTTLFEVERLCEMLLFCLLHGIVMVSARRN